jgi:hypothetical protein
MDVQAPAAEPPALGDDGAVGDVAIQDFDLGGDGLG